MRTPHRALAVLAAACLVLAGCGDDGDDDDEGGGTTTVPAWSVNTEAPGVGGAGGDPPEATIIPAPEGTTISSIDSELGPILASGELVPLYVFDLDEERGDGGSACTAACAQAWPPLLAEGELEPDEDLDLDLGTIEREDGSEQVTVNGRPVYRFTADEVAVGGRSSTLGGQGMSDVWWVIGADGEPIRERVTGAGDAGAGGQADS